MKIIFALITLSLSGLLAGCNAEASRAPTVRVERNGIDPNIPALTISARHMTNVEKLAYDRSIAVEVAGLPSSK